MRIILASQSAGRKKVLESLGLKFEILPANIDEDRFTAKSPLALVKKIARAKAEVAAHKLGARGARQLAGDPGAPYLIIAADSMIVFNGKTYGKPKTKAEAKKYLQMFSGKTHEFLTGLCLLNTNTGKLYQTSAKTRVIFDELTTKEITDYLKIAPVTLFAGGYSLEQAGSEILRPKIKIVGSESNILGLPLEKLLPLLRENGIKTT